MYQNIVIMGFWFYMGVIYEHTFNRYVREWSSYSTNGK